MRRVAITLGLIFGAFFIVRAVVELLTIDYSDPSSYAEDWGGPSLAGVLLVHCGLGLVAAIAIGASSGAACMPEDRPLPESRSSRLDVARARLTGVLARA